MPIDYSSARKLLDDTFSHAEQDLLNRSMPEVEGEIQEACSVVFTSQTQAYREVLLGCVIVRLLDKEIEIRQPYVELGPHAFSGRSLDERVINPFLRDKGIPCSRGPYLSVFRRSIQFDERIRSGLRDKTGYDAFLAVISYIEGTSDDLKLMQVLRYLLYKFCELREAANIRLLRIQRLSLEQYNELLTGLLGVSSGGRFPVLLIVATFQAIQAVFELNWEIAWQGINVADVASGAGGDITISSRGQVLMAAEVTERSVDRARVVATFTTKIAPSGIEDYLFFTLPERITADARQQAHQYFSQGHEVNFLEIKEWIIAVLATIGARGREIFNKKFLDLLDSPEVPSALKMKWNEQVNRVIGRSP